MSYRILEKARLNPVIWKVVLEAPLIARRVKAGQFVIVKIDEKGERIPLTINDHDAAKGTITVIFQEAGATTKRLGCLKKGDAISDILGPLGKETDFGKCGRVVLVAGGVGIAEIFPVAKALKDAGNHVTKRHNC